MMERFMLPPFRSALNAGAVAVMLNSGMYSFFRARLY